MSPIREKQTAEVQNYHPGLPPDQSPVLHILVFSDHTIIRKPLLISEVCNVKSDEMMTVSWGPHTAAHDSGVNIQ